jgi:hypothetical protein
VPQSITLVGIQLDKIVGYLHISTKVEEISSIEIVDIPVIIQSHLYKSLNDSDNLMNNTHGKFISHIFQREAERTQVD